MRIRTIAFQSLAVAFLVVQPSFAQSPNDIVRIEEHWELRVDTPSSCYASPQIANAFAPVKQGDVLYATLNMNHHTFNGDFAAGGLELELWNGDYLLASVRSDKNDILSTDGEVISWKQVITVDDYGIIRFSVCDGASTTWGHFGSNLKLAVYTNLSSLNTYVPDDSVDHSGVVFGANRVDHLRLTKVITTYRSGGTTTITKNADADAK